MANRRFALINRPASGVTESNDLTSAVTWANVPDANITESSVTQHEAALTILESQITDGAILGRVAADEDITGFWDFQDGLQISDVVTTGTQWQIKAEDTYGQLIIEPEAVGGGGNAWGIGLQGGGYIAYGGGTSTLATPGSPAHGDNLNNYTSFMLGDPNDFDYVADIGFFNDTLFQFGTYPVDGNFGFYVTDGAPANWIYPFYVETRNQDTWFLSYTVNIGQTTGGVWDGSGSGDVTTPTKYASLSEDGTDFNFTLTGLTDLNFTGMSSVTAPEFMATNASGNATFLPVGSAAYPRTSFKIGSSSGDSVSNVAFWIFPDVSTGVSKQTTLDILNQPTTTASTDRFGLICGTSMNSIRSSRNVGSSAGQDICFALQASTSDYALRLGQSTRRATFYGDGGIRTVDTGGTDYADLYHDGTDFNIACTNTTDLNLTGVTTLQAGTVDADFDAITATSYGGIAEADLVDEQTKNSSTVNGKTANYTLALTDEGETIRMTGSTASQTITIPANASIAFPVGTLICIQNDASVSWSLAITTDTLTWAEDNTTGTRTLAAGATAVIQKVASTSWKVAGSSLVT